MNFNYFVTLKSPPGGFQKSMAGSSVECTTLPNEWHFKKESQFSSALFSKGIFKVEGRYQ